MNKIIGIVYKFDSAGDNLGAKSALVNGKKGADLTAAELQYINNYILYYEYYISGEEDLKKIDVAIQSIAKIEARKPYETELLLNLYTAKYHHLAYQIGWKAALDIAEQGLQIKDFKQAVSKTQTNYLYDCGYLYDKVGNSYEGIRFYKKSLSKYIKEFGENNTDVALNYNNLAYAYANVYNEKRTIEYYNKAAQIWENIHKNTFDRKDYLITVYQNLTFKYLSYGDKENAKVSCEKLNAHFEKKYQSIENQKLDSYFESNTGYIYTNVILEIALKNVQKAVRLVNDLTSHKLFDYKNKDNLRILMGCNEAIIDFYIENQQYNSAVVLGKKMIAVGEQYQYPDFFATTHSKIAAAYKHLNNDEMALNFINKAIQANNNNKIFNSSKYSLVIFKANLLEKKKQQNSAKLLVKSNVEQLVLDHTKTKKNIEKIKFGDVQDLVSTYFIELFIESGKVYYNQYKAFKNKSDLQIANNLYSISSKLFKEYYLKGEYNEILSGYQSEINEGLLNIAIQKKLSFSEKLELLNQIEQNASEHLIKAYRRKINLNNSDNTLFASINDLKSELYFYKNQKANDEKSKQFNNQKQQQLEKQLADLNSKMGLSQKQLMQISASNFDLKAVLSELENDEVILKYYVTKKNIFCIELTKNAIEINATGDKQIIEKGVKNCLASTPSIQSTYKKQLSVLFKHLIPDFTAQKVIVIPDSFLNYLPFESLFDAKKNRFLVHDFNLSYDYSLPVWLLNKKHKTPNQQNKFVAFAPNYPSNNEVAVTRGDLKDLVFAKKEAAQVAALFKGTTFLNQKATKNAFLESKENFGIFHLSMHSLLFEGDFNKSCLVFANNQRLYFSELYKMNFPAQMVVLSACDTGNGILKSGEGIMSISRALTYAGVNATVMSLWHVPDKETSEIMIAFYENLKKGETKDEALANAKRSFIAKNPLKNHPFYWAGFVVNGNTKELISNYFWEYLTIGIVLFGGLIFAFRKRLVKFF